MSTQDDLAAAFWSHLASDRIVMLATDGAPPRPMAALLKDGAGPVHFFTAADTDLGEALASGNARTATMTFQAKGQDLWASVTGTLTMPNDPQTIDALWSPMTAAWFEGGRDDPSLRLLRLDLHEGEVWEDVSALAVALKGLTGGTVDASDKKGHVPL
ncbi:pyridoxamine 5'-phosphate oxidase family protein [Jannaschia sp. Os4]|uniref:pyridoxamine 5'-phosphate oxidase family protein n=1 Tax=Jannaschia sp. Os4 TaxID=2807617 RepID=UPI00193AA8CD|nr:pyridoxamine 5'-phosphate oxidase family protein [Jannaschia sp. Os4]MBM2575036.1 pyridoxamine 5'-phosphate oxidase family protein [Jannaschia sp. Os4]